MNRTLNRIKSCLLNVIAPNFKLLFKRRIFKLKFVRVKIWRKKKFVALKNNLIALKKLAHWLKISTHAKIIS